MRRFSILHAVTWFLAIVFLFMVFKYYFSFRNAKQLWEPGVYPLRLDADSDHYARDAERPIKPTESSEEQSSIESPDKTVDAAKTEELPLDYPDKAGEAKPPLIQRLGVFSSRTATGWSAKECDPNVSLLHVSIPGHVGKLDFYVYNSSKEDTSATKRALGGWYFEKKEIAKFLEESKHLPLIDIGANLGVVTLQASRQGRPVVAVEPVAQNAFRLCHAVKDFGHAPLVHVVHNAVSSSEGNVTLSMAQKQKATTFTVQKVNSPPSEDSAVSYAILLDRLLELPLPFKEAVLKIDVEGYEGHVLAGAERLFQEVDIPVVWLEWVHVKSRRQYGGAFLIDFMSRHTMTPYNLMSGQRLSVNNSGHWPKTVLWRRA